MTGAFVGKTPSIDTGWDPLMLVTEARQRLVLTNDIGTTQSGLKVEYVAVISPLDS